MSGPVCPDCCLTALRTVDDNNMQCQICGWEGKPWIKMMMQEQGHQIWQETQEKLKRRKEGTLFYLRVFLMEDKYEESNAAFEIMDILNIDHMEGSMVLKVELSEKPQEIILDRIRQMDDVDKVTVF